MSIQRRGVGCCQCAPPRPSTCAQCAAYWPETLHLSSSVGSATLTRYNVFGRFGVSYQVYYAGCGSSNALTAVDQNGWGGAGCPPTASASVPLLWEFGCGSDWVGHANWPGGAAVGYALKLSYRVYAPNADFGEDFTTCGLCQARPVRYAGTAGGTPCPWSCGLDGSGLPYPVSTSPTCPTGPDTRYKCSDTTRIDYSDFVRFDASYCNPDFYMTFQLFQRAASPSSTITVTLTA